MRKAPRESHSSRASLALEPAALLNMLRLPGRGLGTVVRVGSRLYDYAQCFAERRILRLVVELGAEIIGVIALSCGRGGRR